MKPVKNIFLSYTSADRDSAQWINDYLTSRGFNVWFDELKLKYGQDIRTQIYESIRNSDYILALITPNSIKSKWVEEELKNALREPQFQNSQNIIPLIIEGTKVPKYLSEIKGIYLAPNDYHAWDYALDKLIDQRLLRESKKIEHSDNLKDLATEMTDVFRLVEPEGVAPLGQKDTILSSQDRSVIIEEFNRRARSYRQKANITIVLIIIVLLSGIGIFYKAGALVTNESREAKKDLIPILKFE